MSDVFLNPTIVAKEALRQLRNNCVMGGLVYRGYESEWTKQHNGYKVGTSITLSLPNYFRVKEAVAMDPVEFNFRSDTMTLETQTHVAVQLTSAEMTLNLDAFSDRFIKPAMQALSNHVDSRILRMYRDVPAQVGTPGTTPSTFLTYAQAAQYLNEMAAPMDQRSVVINPAAQASIADGLKGLFHQPMVGQMVKKGTMGQIAGLDMYMSQNVNTHTCGTQAGSAAAVDDGGITEGDNIIHMDGFAAAASTFTHGDIFTIADVQAVNPISGIATGSSRQFVVDADATGSGSEQDIYCTPGTAPNPIYSSLAGEQYLPYQNVNTLHAHGAVVTVAGSSGLVHPVNLAFHKDAFALCMVPLQMPASVSWGAQASDDGYSIRVVRDYDVTNDQESIRFDILYAIKCINPFLACRVAG